MNLFYHTVYEDLSLDFKQLGWQECIFDDDNKSIVNNSILEEVHQILRIKTIINSIINIDSTINIILIIGDAYGAPIINTEHWKYSLDETHIYYKYCYNYRNNFSKLFEPYNVVNIAIPGSGFINETSVLHQINYAHKCTNINNFYYDAIILIKCGVFNKFEDQEFHNILALTNIAKKCLINNTSK